MKKLVLPTLFLLGCGCPPNGSRLNVDGPECETGPVAADGIICARSLTFDADKNFVLASIYGDNMGSPDTAAFEQLLADAKQHGLLKEFKLLVPGIEGGGFYCAEIAPGADKNVLFGMFRNLPTDSVRTVYGAASADGCELPSQPLNQN